MKYPTKKQIEKANHLQICDWYSFLPLSSNDKKEELIKLIINKFQEFKGYPKDYKIQDRFQFYFKN